MFFRRRKIILIILAAFLVPLFASQAATTTSGTSQTFSISKDYSFSGQTKVNATLRIIGEKGQFFVEDDYWNTKSFSEQQEILQQIGKLADEFDKNIYPKETNFWGSESNPGIDNDPKVVILLANLVDTAGGYYDTGNQFSKTRVPESNEKDMIYLNIRTVKSENRIFSFLSHEFQHLISFNQKYLLRQANDDIWLNELRSEYSVTLTGYNDVYAGSNLKRRVTAFLGTPFDSLTEWANQAADYGQVDLFAEYLVDHFGSDILKKSLQSNLTNDESLDQALKDNGFNLSFSDIFLNWSVANVLNDILFNNAYGYFREGLRQDLNASPVAPTRLIRGIGDNTVFSLTEAFKDWQAKWIWLTDLAPSFSNKNTLKVVFNGEKKQWFKGAAVIFNRNSTREVKFFDLSNSDDVSQYFNLTEGLEKIIFIPVKMEKTDNFTKEEPLSDLTLTFERVSVTPSITPISTPVLTPTPTILPVMTPTPLSAPARIVRPADFGFREGDFIRAEGDIDVYIINDFGFKRLVLNPQICLLYGHLGARGCFAAVKTVSPAVRDAFKTSYFFTNGETRDGRVYFLELTGTDSAELRFVNMSGEQFVQQGGNFSSVFLFNTREQNTYPIGAELKKLN